MRTCVMASATPSFAPIADLGPILKQRLLSSEGERGEHCAIHPGIQLPVDPSLHWDDWKGSPEEFQEACRRYAEAVAAVEYAAALQEVGQLPPWPAARSRSAAPASELPPPRRRRGARTAHGGAGGAGTVHGDAEGSAEGGEAVSEDAVKLTEGSLAELRAICSSRGTGLRALCWFCAGVSLIPLLAVALAALTGEACRLTPMDALLPGVATARESARYWALAALGGSRDCARTTGAPPLGPAAALRSFDLGGDGHRTMGGASGEEGGDDTAEVVRLREENDQMRWHLARLQMDIDDAMHNGRDMVCWPVG